MTEVVREKLVYVAELDTRDATRAAAKWDDRLESVARRQREVAAAEKMTALESKKLRDEINRLGRAELEATADKRALSAQSRVARQALREQAEASRVLRQEQRSLAAQEKALNAERGRALRLERERAAVLRATASARQRSARADGRMRSVLQQQGTIGGRIEETQAAIEELDRQLAGLGPGRFRRGMSALGGRARSAMEAAPGRFVAGAPGFAMGAGRVAAGLVGGVGAGVAAVGSAGAEYERLRTSLGTAMGGKDAGDAAFEKVRQFAKETPFAVQEVVQAVTTLKVRGIEPTAEAAMEALRIYGDVAGAMGKDLPTVIEAVSDASVGEFERLKEAFNVTAHKAGDEVKFTFAGVTTTVKNNSEEITNYLKSIGQQNFAGGMEQQAKTLGGAWSNLGDAVMSFADDIYRGGLGDALKEVLADITGNVEGADGLAATIGETLAGAVREAYQWLKELLGPTDELPEKFRAAWEQGEKFVSVVSSVIAAGVELASVLEADGVAMLALVAAAGAALGPLGAIAAAAAAIGSAVGTALADGTEGVQKLRAEIAELDQRHAYHEARMRWDKNEEAANQKAIKEQVGRASAAEKAGDRVARAELRALGVTTAAEAAALPEAEKERIRRMRDSAVAGFDRPGLGGSTDLADLQARADAFAGERERRADRSEYDRLSAIPKKRRTPADEKRLKEVAAALNIKVPAGGAGKPHLSTVEQEQKKIIEEGAATAGRRAYDAAILSGRGAEAVSLGKKAEEEAKKRLQDQAKRGEALPGQVNTAFARVAGYSDVEQAPPPPVFVQNIRNEVHAPVSVTGSFTGDPAAIGDLAANRLLEVLETSVFPKTAQNLRPPFAR